LDIPCDVSLVNRHRAPERHQRDEALLGKQRDELPERVFRVLELISRHRDVEDEDEARRPRGFILHLVLHRRVRGEELRGEVLLADLVVVARQRVPGVAQAALPSD
jgi:hypothetical protein